MTSDEFHNPPNTGPHMETFYVFISRDKQGRENMLGATMGPMGLQPLCTGIVGNLEKMKPLARDIAERCKGEKTIHLLKFTNREEVEF